MKTESSDSLGQLCFFIGVYRIAGAKLSLLCGSHLRENFHGFIQLGVLFGIFIHILGDFHHHVRIDSFSVNVAILGGMIFRNGDFQGGSFI